MHEADPVLGLLLNRLFMAEITPQIKQLISLHFVFTKFSEAVTFRFLKQGFSVFSST